MEPAFAASKYRDVPTVIALDEDRRLQQRAWQAQVCARTKSWHYIETKTPLGGFVQDFGPARVGWKNRNQRKGCTNMCVRLTV